MGAGSEGSASGAGAKVRLGVFKLASCDGCQLQLLSCEDELLALTEHVEIVSFAEATSRPDDGGPLDLTLVEGSVSTEAQREHLQEVRARSRFLVTIGACATAGGIQALRNGRDVGELLRVVYAQPAYVDTLAESTPVADHVPVDFSLRGCPIDKGQLLELIGALLAGRKPAIRDESVCMECKRSGQVCVMVAKGEACLGPVTHAGCGALCPTFGRGCYGCFGPKEGAQVAALGARFEAEGMDAETRRRRFKLFTGWAPAFREESER
ncbi:MAG TPA: oxidoreductase [Polyangiaceae bacterium LLY-WYZ-15_(1-7)]|nr:oxidoreductase [Myxococcales bacterium]MAT28276.1 oxidoreductase [Sandaracinus sp.]HJK93646.1 oxidoreductase [Polyangiaceae bacterium LLY-WYZ-15_(1-7)]MBJ70297.1 oxidoreductase [Sandaracinus sp.]HJL05374.1 oxidoreductase [Polyangiaceae bacterium LLY-WYZ-15_(1-7)]